MIKLPDTGGLHKAINSISKKTEKHQKDKQTNIISEKYVSF
jgi:hypothetical protein